MTRPMAVVFLASLLSLTFSPTLAQSFHFEPVSRTGMPAPVPSTLASVANFSRNDSGQIAFTADGAVFLRSNAGLTLVAAVRTPAPGGGEFVSAGTPSINASGQIVFRGVVLAPGRSGLFSFSGGTITQLVADGQQAAGEVLLPTNPAINAAGSVVFLSSSSLFLLSRGSITKIVGRGAPAPGGGTFLSFRAP